MDWLKTIVPSLATALGGPLAGAAATFIADKLGAKESTVDAVKEILVGNSLSPDQVAQLKLAEIEFNKFLEGNKIRLEEIEAADRASARDMQKVTGSWVPGVLALFVTVGFFGILTFMLVQDYKPTDALLVMLGSLGTAWAAIVSFYFGSSHGSSQKNEVISKLAR